MLNIRIAVLTGMAATALLLPLGALADTAPGASATPGYASGTHSGHHGGGMHSHRKMMMRELKRLKLSDDQWTKIHDLDKSFHTSHESAKPTRAEMKAHQDAMMAILTPAQRDQFKKDMDARKAMHQQKMQHADASAQ